MRLRRVVDHLQDAWMRASDAAASPVQFKPRTFVIRPKVSWGKKTPRHADQGREREDQR